jgi:8-oxo-dGTP pyrophosphatase MutT (NUDIX family)
MLETRASGVIVFRRDPLEFLLMEHPTRLDLPKGHVDPGETDEQCAVRELKEETGITRDAIQLDAEFRFTIQYDVQYKKKYAGATARKTVVIFLAWLQQPVEIRLTEHQGYRWVPWNPPHRIQPLTIDPLLATVESHFHQRGGF